MKVKTHLGGNLLNEAKEKKAEAVKRPERNVETKEARVSVKVIAISKEAELIRKAAETDVPEVDKEKVRAIREKLLSGTYRIDREGLVKKLLETLED